MDQIEHNGKEAPDALPPPPPFPPNVTPQKAGLEPVKKVVRVPMARRGLGTRGNKVHILTNHFKVNVNKFDGYFFHYSKVSGSKTCFLVLYVDDILLAINDKGMLCEVKQFLHKNFEMKDMGEASYVIGIKIHRDRSRCILRLSQETYINKVLERCWMKNYSPSVAPIVKGDKLHLNQCARNDLEREQMNDIPYASAIGSLMYAQVCTRPDIAFAVGMLGRYQSNPGLDHWRAAKKVMRYLQGTKDYMLMYRRTENLEAVGHSDSDFAGCVDSRKSTSGYIFMIASGAVSWRGAKQTLIATSTMELSSCLVLRQLHTGCG
ncbi:UNVERIFIED_CONTAM: Retrovirus-related Pol polyprotein from transposon TNT 1-94 [Sesamum radiatum]|uniref:Retrovirus-related Pol polyprotein from transposon TNT 1-94 n=1 Tax=Sesamum radiatum TaxID=300843 RepID=A0AAW2KYS6_SESRA